MPNPVVRVRTRRTLNVESGLNNGLVTPVGLLAIAAAAGEQGLRAGVGVVVVRSTRASVQWWARWSAARRRGLEVDDPLCTALSTLAMTVLLSVIPHGLTADLFATRFGAWIDRDARPGRDRARCRAPRPPGRRGADGTADPEIVGGWQCRPGSDAGHRVGCAGR